MDLTEARHECRRYLDYLAREEAKSKALQKLAADSRSGRFDRRDLEARKREIMGPSPTVYDGANLAEAIRVLLSVTKPKLCGRPAQDEIVKKVKEEGNG